MAVGLSDFYTDCKKYGDVFARTAAQTAKDLLYKEATLAIDNYYGSYSPRVYDREYNIKNNSYMGFYRNSGKACTGGVRITPERMHEYFLHTNWSNSKIAGKVWNEGYHTRGVVTTPPLPFVASRLEDIKQICIEKGEQAAKSESYSVISFS